MVYKDPKNNWIVSVIQVYTANKRGLNGHCSPPVSAVSRSFSSSSMANSSVSSVSAASASSSSVSEVELSCGLQAFAWLLTTLGCGYEGFYMAFYGTYL